MSDQSTLAPTVTIAVAGNPNAGKTALFNALTGVRQKTGNWPGVTVDRKEGRYTYRGQKFNVVDLPGTYSLDALSIDQRIASDYILSDEVDVVVNVVDASNLERHLYLSVQLAEMGVPMVMALNMSDIADKHGIAIDTAALEAALGVKAIRVVSITGDGVDDLEAAIADVAASKSTPTVEIDYGPATGAATDSVAAALGTSSDDPRRDRWIARRLLETSSHAGLSPAVAAAVEKAQADLATDLGDDIDLTFADKRFNLARTIADSVITQKTTKTRTWSDKVDRIVVNRWLGIPIFLVVMYLMFMFTINIGGAFIDAFDGVAGAIFVDGFGALLSSIGAPEWLVVVLANGIGGGIQVVATFIPVVGALYLFLSALEDSGYLARAAFIMDRAMRRVGLPGKAFVPMIVGFGCNVPAVMATRTLENERERKLTIAMNPFMSCGARLPVYALFAAAFFPRNGQNLVFLLYLIGILVAIGTGFVMKHSLLQGESEGFLMDLPVYHRPTLKGVLFYTWDRLKGFVQKAGSVIIVMVMVLAVLNSLGTDGSFGNEDSEGSVLSSIGKTITPVFSPLGIQEDNWPATVGVFTGVLAKEAVVGTLDSLYGALGEQDDAAAAAAADPGAEVEAAEEEGFEFFPAIKDSLGTIPDGLKGAWEAISDPLGLRVGDVSDIDTAAEEQEVATGTFGAMQKRFDGKAGAFAYLLLVLLYFPCVAVIGAVVREAGRGWGLFVALWTTGVAWGSSIAFYQIARFGNHPLTSTLWIVGIAVIAVVSFSGLRKWANRPVDEVPVPVKVTSGS